MDWGCVLRSWEIVFYQKKFMFSMAKIMALISAIFMFFMLEKTLCSTQRVNSLTQLEPSNIF